MIKEVKLLVIALSLLFIVQFVVAHAEHAEPSVKESSILYQIFLLHDWIHPIFFILLIYSCYYFRFFSGRNISKEPKVCLGECGNCYKSEGRLKQYHRYFFWGTLLLLFIHVGEVLPSLNNIYKLSGLDLWVLLSETAYLGFAFLYLGTCYHFRYFIDRLANKKIVSYRFYNKLTSLNRYHNLFFWITITIVAVRFILVVIDTGSIIKAIPGTF